MQGEDEPEEVLGKQEVTVEVNGMDLHGLLDTAMYNQELSVYLTNSYDQNLLIGRGTRAEMLDELKNGGTVFSHLKDKVDRWVIRNGRMIVFIRDENYDKMVEELFLGSNKWGEDPENRPWRHGIETEEYTDKYIAMVLV